MRDIRLLNRHGKSSHRWTILATGIAFVASLAAACSSGSSSAKDAGSAGSGGGSAGDQGDGGSGSGNGGSNNGNGGSGSGNGGSNNGNGGTLGQGGALIGERDSANVLFSGHSLLDNPIPDFIAAIAQQRGDALGWEQQNIPGSPIRVRTRGSSGTGWGGYSEGKNRVGNGRDLLAELANPTTLASGEKYDTLLITERHDPLETVRWEDTVGYLLHYHDRLTANFGAARTLLYQVWPDIDKSNPAPWIEYQTTELPLWECIAGKVNLYLESAGREPSLAVIPGSVALARLVEAALADQVPGVTGSQQQKLDAIFPLDNVHLSDLGRYFIAAVHYSAIFGKSPVGANAATAQVPSATAAALEQLAWQAVSEYFQSGEPFGRTMEDCRTRVANDVCADFYTIRGLSVPNCAHWSGQDSEFNLPDSGLPLPAP